MHVEAIDYNKLHHSLRIIPDNLNIYNSDSGGMNGRSTWEHWKLIPTSRPVINPPPFKANFISIPGGNGSIDACTVLTKHPIYEDRSGSIEFQCTRDYGSHSGWIRTYELIQNYLHGKLFKVVLYDDPNFYYRGRMTVNSWKSDKDWNTITLDYRFEPFKYWIYGEATTKAYYSDISVTGSGFETPNYVNSIAFDFTDIRNQGLNSYSQPIEYAHDVAWTMPVTPEIIVTPKPYASAAPYIYAAGGEPLSNSSYKYLMTRTTVGDVFKITGTVGAGGNAKLWGLLDENYSIIETSNVSSGTNVEVSITNPNAAWLVVNAYVNNTADVQKTQGPTQPIGPWYEGVYIPLGILIEPSLKNPSCIHFVQGNYTTNRSGTVTSFTKKADIGYEYTDMKQHSHKAYGILFNGDNTMIRIYAQRYQKFNVSFRFKWGLL